MHTEHTSRQSALATPAQHFAIVGGMVSAFTDEDACWRFIHGQRDAFRHNPKTFLDARYATRSELTA